MIGSSIGRTVDGWVTDQGGYQYVIKLRMDDEIVAIIQGDNLPLKIGDQVILLNNNNETKVIKNTK